MTNKLFPVLEYAYHGGSLGFARTVISACTVAQWALAQGQNREECEDCVGQVGLKRQFLLEAQIPEIPRSIASVADSFLAGFAERASPQSPRISTQFSVG